MSLKAYIALTNHDDDNSDVAQDAGHKDAQVEGHYGVELLVGLRMRNINKIT